MGIHGRSTVQRTDSIDLNYRSLLEKVKISLIEYFIAYFGGVYR